METYNVIIKEQNNSGQDYLEDTDVKLHEDQYLQFLKNEKEQLNLTHPYLEQQEQSEDPLERSKSTSSMQNMAKGAPTIADVMRELLEMKQEIHQVKLINEGLKVQQKELVKIIAENSVLVKKLRKDPYSNVRGINFKQSIFPIKTKEILFKLEADLENNEKEIVSEMKKIVGDAKLKRAFDRLFTLELILQFNLRGVQNKESFEKLRNLNAALYKVLYKEGYTQDEYQADVRDAFKLLKNRFHKINHSIRKRESGSMF